MSQKDQIEALRAEVAALRADVERAGKNFIVLLDLIKEVSDKDRQGGARLRKARPGAVPCG